MFEQSVVFDRDETRSFIFIIEPRDSSLKINKFKTEQLGQLVIKWFNYFGDPGILKVSPFKYGIDSNSKFLVEIQQVQEEQDLVLKLEVPQDMRFKIFNLSPQNMNLRLDVWDQEQYDVKILSVEEGGELGYLKPNESKEFTLRLFALKCGVSSLSGLLVRDMIASKDIVFQVFSSINVDYE
uniref:Trafficking protein particle complex subunit 13 C-terminal domain-containing protein n=1 Tax=Strombidium rassoulzadegani TaxID=1082188 RepID=A0A7S3FUT1_9SPIT|mmetsp:Transcript_14022/g.23820  ORF Transcript_14022/g.23820 Transcript_14022/m.23820 type:complete len:182 (+) Transcript_14022:956-1501(+)